MVRTTCLTQTNRMSPTWPTRCTWLAGTGCIARPIIYRSQEKRGQSGGSVSLIGTGRDERRDANGGLCPRRDTLVHVSEKPRKHKLLNKWKDGSAGQVKAMVAAFVNALACAGVLAVIAVLMRHLVG